MITRRLQILLMIFLATDAVAHAQGRGQRGAPQAAKAIAPVELTGYWVSVVSEDWRHRMTTPRKGDYESLPLNAEGRRVADTWDLAKDNQAGLQCKAFGIGGITRQPGRLHITWQDDNTLKMDFDAGTQTRLLYFDKSKMPSTTEKADKTWQGNSFAQWEGPALGQRGRGAAGTSGPRDAGGGGQGLRGGPAPPSAVLEGGALKVVTTHFREGYLRKNGVPYSEDATVTEYIHRLPKHSNGDNWLLVVTVVDDPKYLSEPFYTSTQFKLEGDGAKWNPTPCRTAAPPSK
jgi:hypothetical protein